MYVLRVTFLLFNFGALACDPPLYIFLFFDFFANNMVQTAYDSSSAQRAKKCND
jgi:hypothetical protein